MDEVFESLMTVFLAQIDSAMSISEILSEHAGEKEMTPDALITDLVYRLMTPMNDDEMQGALAKGQDMVDRLCSPDPDLTNDESGEEEVDPSVEDPSVEDPIERVITRNTCACDICTAARTCLLNYQTHETQDPLSEKFHNAIKHACSTHKLLIQ